LARWGLARWGRSTEARSRSSIKQVYLEVKAGRGRVGLYAMIVAPVSLALIVAGLYLAFTWR
jgi:hypothetical protein